MIRYIVIAISVVISAAFIGCGGPDGPERVVVEGTVTYGGEPIENGEILFLPLKEHKVPISGAPIVGGRYKVEAKGGVPVGKHKVTIEAYRPRTQSVQLPDEVAEAAFGADPPREQFIPESYNDRSTLEMTIESGAEPITKNFELTMVEES